MAAKKIFIQDNDLDPGADITLEVVTDKYQPTFPHDPNVPIYNINENQGYHTIIQALNQGRELSLDLVNGYLWAVGGHLGVFTPVWKSYGIQISQGGRNVTIKDILDFQFLTNNPPTMIQGPQVPPRSHLTLATYLLAVYRLGKIDQTKVGVYYQNLTNKIEGMLKTEPFTSLNPPLAFANVLPKYDSWTGSPNFSKLVAAYDMILARHPAPLSLMRLATITSAYEGCNSFLSITHLANRLALPVEKALGYVLFRQSAMDVKNMLREGQEVEDPDSYFSHFRALGFSPKSPYSATAAPYFYNLVHLVGSYMGDTRSLNAVAMVDKAIHPIAIVSAYIGNYFMGTGEFGMFVGAEARMDSKKNSRVRPTTAAARSPAQLLVFINAQGNKLLSAFKARYKAVVKSHGTPRPDTMADWINTSL
uniref:Nucleoprotein n=1 Tax=Caledonia dog whelk rhabdo-like virus 2 TaxID=2021945 RepID=A0A221LFP2_9RHAB|nr:putative nucleoprotein [Caledonia dog whelk rhabdo-like virus 2]